MVYWFSSFALRYFRGMDGAKMISLNRPWFFFLVMTLFTTGCTRLFNNYGKNSGKNDGSAARADATTLANIDGQIIDAPTPAIDQVVIRPDARQCVDMLAECNSQCVDYSSDPQNCGACGINCGTSGLCHQSHCARLLFSPSSFTGKSNKLGYLSIIYDAEEKKYKAWIDGDVSTGGSYWSVYYNETTDLFNWTTAAPQEVLSGPSHPSWGCNGINKISVLKQMPENKYHMWYSTYWCPDWVTRIHYRLSDDGKNWGAEQTVLSPATPSDDAFPFAIKLLGASADPFRLYYVHENGDAADWHWNKIDVQSDGVTHTSAIVLPGFSKSAVGNQGAATSIGNQQQNNVHHIWLSTTASQMTLLSSTDQGNTWTTVGTLNLPSNFGVTGGFYDEKSSREYLFLYQSTDKSIYLFEAPSLP